MLRIGSIARRSVAKYGLSAVQPRYIHAARPVFAKVEPVLQENLTEVTLQPEPRPNEPTETKRARLLWQSRKRGILETCVILGKFAKVHLPSLTREELDEYDELMNENDWDIYYWVTDTAEAPKPLPERWAQSKLFAKVQDVGQNKKREIMVQPDLD